MKIEIWSDVMCPFCYIGKRNFENALKKFSKTEQLEVEWKSYQLDPSIPESGIHYSSAEYLSTQKGLPLDRVKQMYAHVNEMAQKSGLQYDLENSKPANSFKSHRIMKMAIEKGFSSEAEEAFFKAHFTDGIDLNDEAELLKIATNIGLDEKDMQLALTDDKYEKLVEADIIEASQLGIQGVPFFVFNRKYAISGAQPPEAFLETIETAFQEWQSEQSNTPFNVSKGQSCDKDGHCD